MFSCIQSIKRSTLDTVQLAQRLHRHEMGSEIEKTIQKNSIVVVILMLSSFLFVKIHRLVKLRHIFRVKRMHFLRLVVRKLLAKCLISMTGDDKRRKMYSKMQREETNHKSRSGKMLSIRCAHY